MVDGYVAFQKFVAIKLHFNPNNDYNYFATSGAIRSSLESFSRRQDRYQFYKLAKLTEFNEEEIERYIFSNLVHNSDIWVKSLISTQCEEVYRKHKRYVARNPLNMFRLDLKELQKRTKHFPDLLKVKNNGPILLQDVFAQTISPETLYLIVRAMPGLYDIWQKKIDNDLSEAMKPLVHDPLYRQRMYFDFLHRFMNHLTIEEIRDIIEQEYFVMVG
jgi:hypothetical protein